MGNISTIQVIELILIIIIISILVRYVWSLFFERNYFPASWTLKLKRGEIPKVLVRLERTYSDKARFFNLWLQVERISEKNISGAFAELGVYKGETAKLIHHAAPDREFHLFDTFEGFKNEDLQGESGEASTYTTRNFADTSIERVKRTISGNDNIVFHPGYFPDTTRGLENLKYSLVNIDADLYNPIRSGLEYFYPRLVPGGVIIVHDYNEKWEGAMRAVDEFAANIPEVPVLLPDREGSVMIFRNRP